MPVPNSYSDSISDSGTTTPSTTTSGDSSEDETPAVEDMPRNTPVQQFSFKPPSPTSPLSFSFSSDGAKEPAPSKEKFRFGAARKADGHAAGLKKFQYRRGEGARRRTRPPPVKIAVPNRSLIVISDDDSEDERSSSKDTHDEPAPIPQFTFEKTKFKRSYNPNAPAKTPAVKVEGAFGGGGWRRSSSGWESTQSQGGGGGYGGRGYGGRGYGGRGYGGRGYGGGGYGGGGAGFGVGLHRGYRASSSYGRAPLERVYQCFSAPDCGLDYGDKLSVPGDVLAEAMERDCQLPLCFCLAATGKPSARSNSHIDTNSDSDSNRDADEEGLLAVDGGNRDADEEGLLAVDGGGAKQPDEQRVETVHCGAQAFNAPEGTVLTPLWVMEALGVREGEQVTLTCVPPLPKGTFAQLQPVSADWVDLSPEMREAVLSSTLSNYQCLTTGTTIRLRHDGKAYDMVVRETKPARAVSIIDADLETDVIEPLEELLAHPQLKVGANVTSVIDAFDSAFFQIRVQDPNDVVEVAVECSEGDACTYMSMTEKRPSQRDSTWMSQSVGSNCITLSAADPHFSVGVFYIAVHAWSARTAFKITIAEGVVSPGQSLETEGKEEVLEPMETCGNCGKDLPARVMMMHELGCARNTTRCPVCSVVLSIEEQEKHTALAHKMLACPCGEAMEQVALHEHKRNACPLRLVPCLYCPLALPQVEVGNHQYTCGSRTTYCSRCDAPVLRKWLVAHLQSEHDITPTGIDVKEEVLNARTPVEDPQKFPSPSSSYFPTSTFSRGDNSGGGGGGGGYGGGGFGAYRLPSNNRRRRAEQYACPHCQERLPNFEELQVHVLTTCANAAAEVADGESAERADHSASSEVSGGEVDSAPATAAAAAVDSANDSVVGGRSIMDDMEAFRGQTICPHCMAGYPNLEDLQIHMLTSSCAKAVLGEDTSGSDSDGSLRSVEVTNSFALLDYSNDDLDDLL